MEERLSQDDQRKLLEIARETIRQKLEGRKGIDFSVSESLKSAGPRGAFVTLHINDKLRGCIGTFRGEGSLPNTISSMSVQAAFHDPRFPPLSKSELDDVEIEISALTPMREVKSPDEIKVGEHGIYITRGFRSGVLLPQVATEHGWDLETFLDHTCIKAGLKPGDWKKSDTKIQIFSAEIFNEADFKEEGKS